MSADFLTPRAADRALTVTHTRRLAPGQTMVHRAAAIEPRTLNATARTVEVVFSTGAPVRRREPSTGAIYEERLSLDPAAVDLSRLNGAGPVLAAHRTDDLSAVIGVVEAAWLAGGQALARVRISARPEVEPIWRDIAGGILRSVSVGYAVDAWSIQARADAPDLWTATRWTPYEISFVPIPADAGAQVRGSHRPGAAAPDPVDATAQAAAIWQRDPAIRKEFRTLEIYSAWFRANAAGRAQVFGGGKIITGR